jgi:hypothetical protein
MTATGQNFEIYQGDTKDVFIVVTDVNGAILDLTPYDAIRWVVYHQVTKALILEKDLASGISVPVGTDGVLKISLVPADTESIVPNTYNHECEVSSGGTVVATVTVGTVKIIYSKA